MQNHGKSYLKWKLSALFFTLLMGVSFAQTREVKGRVTDDNNHPIPGVNVIIKGINLGVMTNMEGEYIIKADTGDVLRFSFIGFKTEEKRVGESTKMINIVMKEDVTELDDVVVVGYGTAKNVSTVVGSVVKVDSEKISNKPSASLLDALQGKVAGLSISSSSGEPSSAGTIRLHGIGSVNGGGEPLYVLDGSPVSRSVVIFMNPNDFESVTVLKDASATSIYGTRAANGVIYITTKKGKGSDSATFSVSSQYGLSFLASRAFFDDFMNLEEYSQYMVEKEKMGFGYNGEFTEEWRNNLLSQENPPNTRWDRVYFRDYRPSQQITVSASGGNTKTRYYISGGYFSQEGMMYKSNFERFTARLNLNATLNNWLKTNISISTGYSEYMQNPNTGSNADYGSLGILYPPHYRDVDEKGKRYDVIPDLLLPHPHYIAENTPSVTKNISLIPQLSLTATPIKNLTIKSQLGIEYRDSRAHSYEKPSYREESNLRNYREDLPFTSRSSTPILKQTLTNTAEYKLDFAPKRELTFLLGQESIKDEYSTLGGRSEGQTSDEATMIIHGNKNIKVYDGHQVTTFNSFFLRLDYIHDNKYFFDVSVRRDGSSRFGKNNQYTNFWAVGALWKAGEENFLKKASWLDRLDLKYSVGTSGNADAINDYLHLSLASNTQFYKDRPSYVLSSPGNPDLQWQKQIKQTLGLNVGLFKRVYLNTELYYRLISDMLTGIARPTFSGNAGISENGGELRHRGIDVSLSVDVLKGKDFFIAPFLSFNYNQEKVLSLHEGKKSVVVDVTSEAYIVGEPIRYYYPMFYRINPDDGRAQWFLPGDDPTVMNNNTAQVTTDFNSEKLKQNTGVSRYAPINGGFGLEAGYKNFRFNMAFAYTFGKYSVNIDRYRTENPIATIGWPNSNQSRRVLENVWKQPGDIATFPSYQHNQPFTEKDDRLIENASYIRMKDITLSYSLSEDILRQIGFFKELRFYTTGRNLLTFTNYRGIDPEFDVSLSPSAGGGNPNTKQYTFGIDIKF
ncbi:SusC/RagA family TonB-linked outer membrane protein [Capnocytophaga sp.]|uniref:SusC/RagA family TonB-linked outer membrane protein n=1 Tax=Capnocytophaga sp. TaxID=44737 RepID=UPI0026DB2952|nr:SusC/RagA family TonB-linked outer membrane protein [Capnocytophaga sp.]MDO5105038.1 SusC/RagA family TonB-linked outer membrane protein [Capnocytophaga sp.]